jgi:hypothetical protein
VDLRKRSIPSTRLSQVPEQQSLAKQHLGGNRWSLGTILLIILVLLLIGVLPAWPYSAAWGPAPAGILGVILIVVLINGAVLTEQESFDASQEGLFA